MSVEYPRDYVRTADDAVVNRGKRGVLLPVGGVRLLEQERPWGCPNCHPQTPLRPSVKACGAVGPLLSTYDPRREKQAAVHEATHRDETLHGQCSNNSSVRSTYLAHGACHVWQSKDLSHSGGT